MMGICEFGDPILASHTEAVINPTNSRVDKLAHRLEFFRKSHNLYGLSAPQIGHDLSMFCYSYHGDTKTLINPEILDLDDTNIPYEEGCISVPNLYFHILRPSKCKIIAQQLDGSTITMAAEGDLARIILHHIDHLGGLLVVDHLPPKERRHYRKLLNGKSKTEIDFDNIARSSHWRDIVLQKQFRTRPHRGKARTSG